MLLPAALLDTVLLAAINRNSSIGLIQASWEIFFSSGAPVTVGSL